MSINLNILGLIGWVIVSWSCQYMEAGEVKKLSAMPPNGMKRADLFYVEIVKQPQAVLVLCPGYNGSAKELIDRKVWQDFSRSKKLGLVALSFASDGLLLKQGTGYYYPTLGSGDILLQGLRKIYKRDLPLILYGISGGAHFASRFVEWKPGRVLSWCAYSAAWWDEPSTSSNTPPGLVACGERDVQRYGATMMYFKKGRVQGKPWLWVSLGGTGHKTTPEFDQFVRNYFASILRVDEPAGSWVDLEDTQLIGNDQAVEHPTLSGWLPNTELREQWRKIHAP
jgi:hypothetical protein